MEFLPPPTLSPRTLERSRTSALALALVLACGSLVLALGWWLGHATEALASQPLQRFYLGVYLAGAAASSVLALLLHLTQWRPLPAVLAALVLTYGCCLTWADLQHQQDYIAYTIATFVLGVAWSAGPVAYGLSLAGSFIALLGSSWLVSPAQAWNSDFWTQCVILALAFATCLLLERQRRESDVMASQLERLNQELKESAFRDPLTGLYNRRFLTEFLAGKKALAARMSFPLSLVLIDLDHFKRVNDTLGHTVGDDVLRELAGFLKRGIRESDLAARYGGEEFILILPQASAANAARVVVRILEKVRKASFPGVPWTMTFSAGVAELAPQETVEELLERADRKMYEAKQSRNLVLGGSSG